MVTKWFTHLILILSLKASCITLTTGDHLYELKYNVTFDLRSGCSVPLCTVPLLPRSSFLLCETYTSLVNCSRSAKVLQIIVPCKYSRSSYPHMDVLLVASIWRSTVLCFYKSWIQNSVYFISSSYHYLVTEDARRWYPSYTCVRSKLHWWKGNAVRVVVDQSFPFQYNVQGN